MEVGLGLENKEDIIGTTKPLVADLDIILESKLVQSANVYTLRWHNTETGVVRGPNGTTCVGWVY